MQNYVLYETPPQMSRRYPGAVTASAYAIGVCHLDNIMYLLPLCYHLSTIVFWAMIRSDLK